MRKLVLALAFLIAPVLPPAVSQAAPHSHEGSFTFIKYGPSFRHRVFLRVDSSNHGDKSCDITLNGRTQSESLGTSGETETFNMFYLYVTGAQKAFAQAQAATSPTPRISCSH